MADTPRIHLDALRLVEQLPADANWDEVAYEVYVRQTLAQGIADAESDHLVDHDDALVRVRARILRAA